MRDRDVSAFDRRAAGYESGAIGQMHQRIGERVAGIAVAVQPDARRVLDVGCGTGALLRHLARRLPDAQLLAGIDPACNMVAQAVSIGRSDPRIHVGVGVAEALPIAADTVDLIVAVTSFDHWTDQQRGLAECGRVLRRGGSLLLCDLFSAMLLPTMWRSRRGKARTVSSASALLRGAGFRSLTWHRSPLIKTVVAELA